ncbi:uncharacterized protein LOC124192335 [Daphnia pulex]|uniref:uncharacterized protein LOC124192335 n=1 Tax=Daphnia pulex TaxID=6669 RepID=UPI001EE097AA|nr:uncharacterized protein LOC124192335 [Daphnia pulex]
MSRTIAISTSCIFAFLMLTNKLEAAAVGETALNPGNFLNILSLISENLPIEDKSLNETVKNCPKLWTQKEKNNEATGILGSFTELQKLCPEKSKNSSLVCSAAIWTSKYVCTASLGDTRQLPDIRNLKDLTNVSDLCNALVRNANLTQTLCGIVKDRLLKTTSNSPVLKEKLDKICSLPNESDNCEQYCSKENQNLCKIILQSLRTIVFWEEKKENQLKETVAKDVETESTPTVAVKAAFNPSPLNQNLTETPVVKQDEDQPIQEGNKVSPAKNISLSTPTLSATTTTTSTKMDTEKNQFPLIPKASSSEVPKTTKSPSTVSTVSDPPSLNTETTVTDEDFGLDDNFGSADKPPIKTADEDPQSYEVGDDMDKEEKGMDKQDERIPVETQKTVPSYDLPSEIDGDPINTHFLFYFIAFVILSACGYLMFMRRKYLIALVLEGRSNSSRRRSSSLRERPSSGNYRKLVNNLEEAITSNSVKNSNVIY